MSAFRTSIAVGSSAAGSAWARLPPIVSAVPDVDVADLLHRVAQKGAPLGDDRRPFDGPLARHRADAQDALVGAQECELVDAVQIDEVRRPGEPKVHQRHQALPAGERLRLVAVLGEKR
jgi:hypothetical protein